MNSLKLALLISAATFIFQSQSNAALTLTVHTENKTITLSGSDNGFIPDGPTSITWTHTDNSAGADSITFAGETAFSEDNDNPAAADGNPAAADGLDIDFVDGTTISLVFNKDNATGGAYVFDGSGNALSYAALSAATQTRLEALNVEEFTAHAPWDNITVTVVPEPEEVMLLSCLPLIAFGVYRRVKAHSMAS